MNKTSKRMMLFCEPCSFKTIIDSEEVELAEVKNAPIQQKLPTFDPSLQKPIVGKTQNQAKMYKCTKCGRGVRVRELLKPFGEAFKLVDEQKIKQQEEESKRKRLEDGKPEEKKPNPNFTG
jgi:DNA-directed RNA polymerase subunit RPC12/RpoP